jgi:hypothetical protein
MIEEIIFIIILFYKFVMMLLRSKAAYPSKKGYHTVITPITPTKIQNKKAFVKSLSPFYSQTFGKIWKDSENWLKTEKSIAT